MKEDKLYIRSSLFFDVLTNQVKTEKFWSTVVPEGAAGAEGPSALFLL